MCQSARKVLDGAMPSFSASNHPPTFARALVYTVAVCRVVFIMAYIHISMEPTNAFTGDDSIMAVRVET